MRPKQHRCDPSKEVRTSDQANGKCTSQVGRRCCSVPLTPSSSRPLHNRELKADLLACQLPVHGAKSLQLVLRGAAFLRVQVHLEDLGGVSAVPHALAHHLCRVHKVLQDCLVHGGEGAAAGAGIGLTAGGGGHDAAVGDDDHVLAAELLLKLPHQPLLDLVEALQQPEGHVNDDGLAAASDINLLGGGDVQVPQVRLQLRVGCLQVEQSLGDRLLKDIRLRVLLLQDLLAGREHGG
mmetsp:Transcript_6257/g.17970  ORF Transcript_6257/g.17970 Transcript_6257/m.17970 type:complete len:237 (-) Transcript_6257:85-795(-)